VRHGLIYRENTQAHTFIYLFIYLQIGEKNNIGKVKCQIFYLGQSIKMVTVLFLEILISRLVGEISLRKVRLNIRKEASGRF
jgi:hypothetical protein